MCKQPIVFETLVAYWLGEVVPAAEEPLEEHLFACASCSGRLETLGALASGLRTLMREGRAAALITPKFLEALRREGLRIREYRVPPGGSVNCTLLPGEDAVVGRMQVPLAGVKRLDALTRLDVGGEVTEARLEDL